MKVKKILAVSSAMIIAATSSINSLSVTVFAQENTVTGIESSSENEVNKTVLNEQVTQDTVTDDTKSRKIYVKTFAGNGGNGSEERPFNNFKDAYNFASENDTIVLLNAVTIQNDDNNLDNGVFTFTKQITITSKGDGNGELSSRVPVQLGANIKLEDIEFAVRDNIYLNGHTLEMNNVKNFKTVAKIPTVYGGSYQNGTNNKGTKSILKVNGFGEPFEFNAIYAGSENGESDIPVTLDLIKGVKVKDGIYASGVNAGVNANVEFKIGNINAGKFENNNATHNTTIIFNEYYRENGPILKGFNDVELQNTRIKVKNKDEFSDIQGKLELDSRSSLDLSNITTNFSVGSFNGEDGSKLILSETGKIEISGELTGSVELRTPGVDVASSGIVREDHIYISAANTSSGNVTFKPFVTQPNLELKKEDNNGKEEWIIRAKKIDKPIENLDIVENKKVKIEKDIEQAFTLEYYDKNGSELEYKPQFEFIIKDPNGQLVDDDKIEVISDIDPTQMMIYVYDDTIEAGNYTIVITETASGKMFEIPLEFYKESQQNLYLVEFNANGGKGIMEKQSIELNFPTKLRKNTFTREGYIFKGWSRQPNGNVEYTDEQEIQNLTNIAGEEVLLYAVWAKEWYDINAVPIINATDKVLTVGENFNPLEGVTAYDKEDGDIILTDNNIISNNVNMNVVGTYNVTYKVTDNSGASAIKIITVVVNPKMEELNNVPIINATDKVLTVGENFNPLEGVTAYDKEDGDIILTDNNIISNNVNMNVVGTYNVTYKVTDNSGASAIKIITVVVNPKMEELNNVPIINATDKVLTVGENFNPLEGVTAYDKEDGEITIRDENIIKNTVDMSRAGTYEVVYKVTDKMGASITKTINVIVNEKNIVESKPESAKPSIGGNATISKLPNTGLEGSLPILGGGLIALGSILVNKKKKN